MTPTRQDIYGSAPYRHKNGILKTRQKLIVVAGSIFTVMGLAALGSELFRTFSGLLDHFRWVWIGVAMGVTGIGLILIQTLNPMKVLEIAYRIYSTRMQGGRRATDPPPDTAPPPCPPEKWPAPDPLWRDPTKRTRRDD